MIDPEKMLAVLHEPRSIVAESYRALRTSMQRALGNGVHAIMFVSAYSGDGKSTVCSNVAATLTQLFLDVIIVDCDLRRPTVSRLFNAGDKPGLSNFLAGDATMKDVLIPTGVDRLRLVPSGTSQENAGDLLGRPSLPLFCKQVRDECDVVLFDTSPLGACSDALSLGPHVDASAMVINPKRWDGELEVGIRQSLETHNIPLMGVILNGTDPTDGYGPYGYARGYGYGKYGKGSYGAQAQPYGYGYGYGEEPQPVGNGKTANGKKRKWLSWLLD